MMTTFKVLLLLWITCKSTDKYPQFTSGRLVRTVNLRPEKRNNSRVQQNVQSRARMMSNSFGIIMDPPTQVNTKNATEVRVRWIGNDSVKLGINPRYLRLSPQMVIHVIPFDEANAIDAKVLWKSLDRDKGKQIYAIPHEKHLKSLLAIPIRYAHPDLPAWLTIDELIAFDILATWFGEIREKKSKNSTMRDLHVINQEPKTNDFLSISRFIDVSQFLTVKVRFISKVMNSGSVIYQSWVKEKLLIGPIAPVYSRMAFEVVVKSQLQHLKKFNNATRKHKSKKLPSFVIHPVSHSYESEQELVQKLSEDMKNIVLVWPSFGIVEAIEMKKNVFYQNVASRDLYNSTMAKNLNYFCDHDVVPNSDQLAEELLYFFAVAPEVVMDMTMASMCRTFSDAPYFTHRLHLMTRIKNDSSIGFIQHIIDYQARDLRERQRNFKKGNNAFWKWFGAELKRAIMRTPRIRLQDDLNNAMAFEAILYWEMMRKELDASYSLHVISPNDAVFNRANMKALGSFWMTPALKSVIKIPKVNAM